MANSCFSMASFRDFSLPTLDIVRFYRDESLLVEGALEVLISIFAKFAIILSLFGLFEPFSSDLLFFLAVLEVFFLGDFGLLAFSRPIS